MIEFKSQKIFIDKNEYNEIIEQMNSYLIARRLIQ